MDLSYLEETTLEFDLSSLVHEEMSSSDSDFTQQQQQFIPQNHQQQQEEEQIIIEFSEEELQAIQEINELFEAAPFFNETQQNYENADQNLNYLEQDHSSAEASFDDESIYMDEGQMYTEFEDLNVNNLMMLMTPDVDEMSFEEMEDEEIDEAFQRVPSPASVVSAHYTRFPQP